MLNFYHMNLTIHLVKSKIPEPTVALHSIQFLEGALEKSYVGRPFQQISPLVSSVTLGQ